MTSSGGGAGHAGHTGHTSNRRPASGKVAIVGTIVSIGIALYVLIITHHLQLPMAVERMIVLASTGRPYRVYHDHIPKRADSAFAIGMLASGVFEKYDKDGDDTINHEEFYRFLADLGKSSLVASQLAGDRSEVEEDVQVKTRFEAERYNQALDAAEDEELKRSMRENAEAEKRRREEAAAAGGAAATTTTATAAVTIAKDAALKESAMQADAERRAAFKAKRVGGGAATATTATAATANVATTDAAFKEKEMQDDAERRAAFTAKTSGGASTAAATAPTTLVATTASGAAAVGGDGVIKVGGMCPELSKELVASFAKENTIMLAVCDWRMFETFGRNWMTHLKEIRIDYYIVGSTDRKTAEFLSGQGNHPCFKFFEEGAENKMVEDYRFGDAHYIEAVWRKVSVVHKIVEWGFNVLHSDVDAVWFRDPIPYFLGPACEDVDLAVSTDLVSTHNPPGDDGLEKAVFQEVNVNTGMYFVKASEGGKRIMQAWVKLREQMKHENDQIGMYRVLRSHKAVIDAPKRRLYYKDMDGGPASVGLLSVGVLLNGYSYFIPRLHEAIGVKPLGVHFTWLPLSREGKYHRMRDGMLYHDPPEYYTEPMFITADIDFPITPEGFNEWQDTEAMIQTHVKLMDMQLVQVYRVMAIALILNRTLVLPNLHCFCYKNWFMSEQCRIPGDKVTYFPMECAMDQWLRPKVMYNYNSLHGPIMGADKVPRTLHFREYTMLENERFPHELRKVEVNVVAMNVSCGPGEPLPECGMLKLPDPEEVAYQVPKGLKEKQVLEVFEKLKDVKVIRLKGAMQMFGGFDDQVLQESFEKYLDKVAVNWCCRHPEDIKRGMKEKEKLLIHW